MQSISDNPTEQHVLLLGDLHIGSWFGLWGPGNIIEGAEAPLTKWQSFLYSKWLEFLAWLPAQLTATICNGDTLHGEERACGGRFCTTPDLANQARAAERLLAPIRAKSKRLYFLSGTPYHESFGSELDLLGSLLGAEKWAGERYAGLVLERKVNGLTLNVSHHQTAGWIYPSGGADRTALFSAATEALCKGEHADIIVRSHLHVQRIVNLYGKWVCFLPAWQIVTPYAIQRMEFYRATVLGDLGAVLLVIGADGQVSFKTFNFTLPRGEMKDL